MSGSEISEDLLYVECALELCGVKLAETAMAECASLLTIIRKKLKVILFSLLVSKATLTISTYSS